MGVRFTISIEEDLISTQIESVLEDLEEVIGKHGLSLDESEVEEY